MPTEEGRRIEKYVKAQFDRVAAESSRDEIRDDEEAHANAVIQALIEDGLARMEATKDTLRDEIRDEILPRPTSMLARSTCVGASTKWREGRSTRVPTSNRLLPLSATRPATSKATSCRSSHASCPSWAA